MIRARCRRGLAFRPQAPAMPATANACHGSWKGPTIAGGPFEIRSPNASCGGNDARPGAGVGGGARWSSLHWSRSCPAAWRRLASCRHRRGRAIAGSVPACLACRPASRPVERPAKFRFATRRRSPSPRRLLQALSVDPSWPPPGLAPAHVRLGLNGQGPREVPAAWRFGSGQRTFRRNNAGGAPFPVER